MKPWTNTMMQLGLAVSLTVIGCTAASAVELKYVHMNSPKHPVHQWGEMVAKAVSDRTAGAVTFSFYPSAQLGENAQVAEQVSFGADILTQVGPGHLAQYVPDYAILSGPFLFKSAQQEQKFLKSDLAAEWASRLESSNIKLLCFSIYGTRDLYTRDKVVHGPEDTAGLKLRVQPLTIYTEMVKALGAAPTPMPWPEVYSALAQGVIDAAEAPPAAMLDQKHYENVKYYIQTQHTIEPVPFIISRAAFDNLTEEQQAILEEEANKACDWLSEDTIANYESGVKQVAAQGVTVITDVDREAFAKATRPIYDQFPEWTPGLYEKVQAAVSE